MRQFLRALRILPAFQCLTKAYSLRSINLSEVVGFCSYRGILFLATHLAGQSTILLLGFLSVVRIFRPNSSSAGLTPVVGCGSPLYAVKYVLSSFLQSFFSAWAIFSLFRMERFWRSTSPYWLPRSCDIFKAVRRASWF